MPPRKKPTATTPPFSPSDEDIVFIGSPSTNIENQILTYYERINPTKLMYIINNYNTLSEQYGFTSSDDGLKKLMLYLARSSNGLSKIVYQQREKCPRYFYMNYGEGLCGQNMPGIIRNTIFDGYDDLDFVNCGPTISNFICFQMGFNNKSLAAYIENREQILNHIMIDNHVDRETAKRQVTVILNDGTLTDNNNEFLKELYWDMDAARKKFIEDNWMNSKDDITPAQQWARYVFELENKALMAAIEYWQELGAINNELVLVFDGFMAPHTPYFSSDMALSECNKYILQKTGIPLKMIVKKHSKFISIPEKVEVYEEYKSYMSYKHLMLKSEVDRDDVIRYCNAAFTLLKNNSKQYTLVKSKDEFGRPEFTVQSLSDLLSSLDVNINYRCFNGKITRESLCKIIKKDLLPNGALPVYNRPYFLPYCKSNPCSTDNYNMFNGFAATKIKPKQQMEFVGSMAYEHIRKYMCNEAEEGDKTFNYVMKWIAFMIQYPEKPINTMLLFYSRQGVGKGWLCNTFLRAIIGDDYCTTFGVGDELFDKFNSAKKYKVLLCADEINDKGAFHTQVDKLKSVITETSFLLELKGIDKVEVKCHQHIIGSTNNQNGVYLEKDNRRIVAIRCDSSIACNTAWFSGLFAESNNPDFIHAAYKYFAEMDLTGFNPYNFHETKYASSVKIDQINNSIRFIKQYVENIVDNKRAETIRVSITAFYESYKKWCDDSHEKFYALRIFKNHLSDLGIECKKMKLAGGIHTTGFNITVTELRNMFRSYLRMPMFEFSLANDLDTLAIEDEL